MAVLSALEPKKVFEYFEKLCAVPHGSGNTKQISDLCVAFAKEQGLRYRQDSFNNVIIWKDGSAGYENAAPLILQGHLDMVCVQTSDSTKNMETEGINLCTDGKYVWADKTSLGGDDGIAAAMILAILADDTLSHPPLEAVFTVDEEIGLVGVAALDCSDLRGRRMINIDSEEEGVFTVSCAGGMRLSCLLPGEKKPSAGETGYRLTISGLLGGHSGVEINKGRASATHLMGRVLYMIKRQIAGLRIAELRGGNAVNAICAEAVAEVLIPKEKEEYFGQLIKDFEGILKNEYARNDSGLILRAEKASVRDAFDSAASGNMLFTLFVLPQGVCEMSPELPRLVQTSLNLGMIATEKDGLRFAYSIRSSVASRKEHLRCLIHAAVERAGGTVSESGDYPGWPFVKDSALCKAALAAYCAVCGREGEVSMIHAGLECGILAQKIPGLDAISIGPNLEAVHSPKERLDVESTMRIYLLLCEILKNTK